MNTTGQDPYEAETQGDSEIERAMRTEGPGERATEEAQEGDDSGIRIGNKTFKNQEEAFAYAQQHISELEMQKQISDAYQQGQKEALQYAQVPQGVTSSQANPAEEEDNFEEEFYADPKAYLKKYAERIRQTAKKEVLKEVQQTQAEQQLWQEFFSKNEDLTGFREEVELVLSLNRPEVENIARTKGKKAALSYLANATRKRFHQYAQRLRPQREMPRTMNGPSPGGSEEVTPSNGQKEPKQKLDFADQIKQHKKRR